MHQGPLADAIKRESERFAAHYSWLEQHMPPLFFEEVDRENIVLIVHNLMALEQQNYLAHIHLKHSAIALTLDTPDADLRILEHYKLRGIKNYRVFVSNGPPPFDGVTLPLRIAVILYTEFYQKWESAKEGLKGVQKQELHRLLQARNPKIAALQFDQLLEAISSRFAKALTQERLILALDMLFRSRVRDTCQYEVRLHEDWKEKRDSPSMQIVLAWRNVPKHNFLYRLAQVIYRHNLTIRRVHATYIDPYSRQNVLLMSLGLHGRHGKGAWEEANIADFLQELVLVKSFEGQEEIETTFVDTGLLSGNLGSLLKAMHSFIHQALVHADPNIYTFGNVGEGLCRHPELTVRLAELFEWKFHPEKCRLDLYEKGKGEFLTLVEQIDTGHAASDLRRKNILNTALQFIEFTLKTNFYRNNKTAFSFRLDPGYLEELPFERKEKFPELPYAIFFMKGRFYLGFHIRFRDLARGGLRTIIAEKMEQLAIERGNVFSECYALAYTQQKKNKDIPEGGAKGVILLDPYEKFIQEEEIYRKEMELSGLGASEIEEKIASFRREQKLEFLHQAQRSYIESFVTLLNCLPDGTLKAKHIIDYYKRPEYIYLGPDENMHNEMIEWIATYSTYYDYKPKGAFISSKPSAGINHKEYGVTSLGINVYMEEVLKFLAIDPAKKVFTIKMSGGPDGDVAGNQILNLYRFYPRTAKLLALIDGSGTIFDPQGLDLSEMEKLFRARQPIRHYPPDNLSEGGFLLDTQTKREQSAYAQTTLCWRKKEGKLIEEWLSGHEMNHLLRYTVHQVKADIFIPAGGRPRTLNENNIQDFFDEKAKATARAIVEGANLYLTPQARHILEEKGTLIVKDSSANKGGVICSSFEVLCGLVLSSEEFIQEKKELMPQILQAICNRAKDEATLLLSTHKSLQIPMTEISDMISEKINRFKDELLTHLQTLELSTDPQDSLVRCLLNYCPPLLRDRYSKRILNELPDVHKKAIIASYIASRLVYARGLGWSPTVVDVLPLISSDPVLLNP